MAQTAVHSPAGAGAAIVSGPETVRCSSMVDLLMSAGHVDGNYGTASRPFIQSYVDTMLTAMEQTSMDPPEVRARMQAAWRSYFDALEHDLAGELAMLAQDPPAPGGGPPERLRSRVLAVFRGLSWSDQATALELVHALLHASDATSSPAKLALYHELTAAFATLSVSPPHQQAPRTPSRNAREAPIAITAPVHKELTAFSHPLLDPLEQTYSPHPIERKAQLEWDYQLLQQAMMQWYRQRTAGAGRLAGLTDIAQLPPGSRFLDGFVYAMRPAAPVELIVLGDLHGCYSCLKAALLQSNFIERAWAHQWDPGRYPDVKLVFLGDYIDRGRFSLDGVLRAALQLFVSMPDQVILLRGNHEWLTRHGDHIASGVYPAEALASIVGHAPLEMLEGYRQLFEYMPTSLLCERTLLVHAGIPRGDTFEARYHDLSSLNEVELRFQMMWSDPDRVDHIPVEQQRLNPRFSFGREQFRAFMERVGMTTMIRGHEQIDRGFDVFYDLGDRMLLTLFSAGGEHNADLPQESSYRAITPMALSLQYGHGPTPIATPWPIYYAPFNYEPHNGLYRAQPLLDFRYT